MAEVIGVERDRALEVEAGANTFEVLESLENNVDVDGFTMLVLLVWSGIVENNELLVLEILEPTISDELCSEMEDTDGLTILKLLELLVCRKGDDSGIPAVVETPELVKPVELCSEKVDADGLAKLELLRAVDSSETADNGELTVLEVLAPSTSVEI